MDIARSIVKDADLDECSEHKTNPLGDSGLYDIMKVCCISIIFVLFSSTFVPFLLFILIVPFNLQSSFLIKAW